MLPRWVPRLKMGHLMTVLPQPMFRTSLPSATFQDSDRARHLKGLINS